MAVFSPISSSVRTPCFPSTSRAAHPGLSARRAVALASGLVLAGAGLLATPTAQAQTQAEPAPDWVPGRLIVMSRAGLADTEMAKVAKKHGGRAHRIGKSDLHVIELPKAAPETAVRHVLAREATLKFVELDRRVPHDMVANDPYTGSQWHLPKIGAPTAWEATQGSGITIAILDSGVLPTHPDLASKLVAGWNFYDNNANTADVTGHGTSVAGSAAAITNNGAGVSGIAGAAKIMPLRVADATGYAYYSTIAQAVIYAADKGARVANASFAGAYGSAAVQSAAQYLRSKGGLLVVSAGNTGTNANSTAVSSLIPVGATDANDAKASFSTMGNHVAVAAPGVGIWTTASNGGYRSASGTSYAAPITAGVIALMMAARPTLTPDQVQTLLFSTATDLGTAGRDINFGHGRVNASAAVAAAAATGSTVALADTQAPTVAITRPTASGTVSGLAAVDVGASDNVGVARVELSVNGSVLASDAVAPYQFSWDTSKLANGLHALTARAFDAAGNAGTSSTVTVNVANAVTVTADKTAPVVSITNPVAGSTVAGTVQVALKATDNAGTAGITQTLYINGVKKASGTGGSLFYSWNTAGLAKGTYTLLAVASDAAKNQSSTKVQVKNY